MSMQINVNPAGLTQEQREAVAGFILAYPAQAVAKASDTLALKVTVDTDEATRSVDALAAHARASRLELETLQHDHESTIPAAAFGAIDPAVVAFGTPLAQGAAVTPATTPAIVAPPPPANTAPISTTPGLVSSVAPAAPGVAASVGVELDKSGLPWDARIHADSKAKIADGTWRKKRNLDPAVLTTVELELRQVMNAPAPAPTDARQQFVSLIGRVSAGKAAGKITQEDIDACCVASGVPALPLLANRLDLVEVVAAQIDAIIISRS